MNGSQVNKIDLLQRLILEWENETIEFKSTNPGRQDISEYVSALANEAFLNNKPCGWYVMGVDNKSHEIVGTQFKNQPGQISDVLTDIKMKTGAMSDVRVDEIIHSDKRVLIFKIAAASPGCPIYSQGHAYGRNGDQLVALSKDKEDQIRFSAGHYDWSAQLAHNSSTEDLDIHALSKAREVYLSRKPHLTHEVKHWTDTEFLQRLRLIKGGKLTYAALVLLGKVESLYKTGMSNIEIRWILQNT